MQVISIPGLSAQLDERPHLRVSYDSGRLEVLRPSTSHEQYGTFVDLVVFAFCEVRGLNLRCFGQSTLKAKALAKVRSRMLAITSRASISFAESSIYSPKISSKPYAQAA